jgi:hypothetical protein
MTLTLLYWKEQVEAFEQAFLCEKTESARINCLKGLVYLADLVRETIPEASSEIDLDLQRCKSLVCQKQTSLWLSKTAPEVSRHCRCNPFLPE